MVFERRQLERTWLFQARRRVRRDNSYKHEAGADLNALREACRLRTRSCRRRCVDHLRTVLYTCIIKGTRASTEFRGSDRRLTRGKQQGTSVRIVVRRTAVPDGPSGVWVVKYIRPW